MDSIPISASDCDANLSDDGSNYERLPQQSEYSAGVDSILITNESIVISKPVMPLLNLSNTPLKDVLANP